MFRFCKLARIRRLSGRAPSTKANSNTANRIKVIYHRGWSTHTGRDRYRNAQPNQKVSGFCVTSGDLGTHAMHPPRKRITRHLQNHQPSAISKSQRAGGHGGPPLRRDFFIESQIITDQPDNAPRGGMLSGWAASRTVQCLDFASQHAFGGYQGGHHPRWPIPTQRIESKLSAIGYGRPTQPEIVTEEPSRTGRLADFA